MNFDKIIDIIANGDSIPEVSKGASFVACVAIVVAVVALIISMSPTGRTKGVYAIIECIITIICMIIVGITKEFWMVQLCNILFVGALFATMIPQTWELIITDDLEIEIRCVSSGIGFVAGLIVGYFMSALCAVWLFCVIWGILTVACLVITIVAFNEY